MSVSRSLYLNSFSGNLSDRNSREIKNSLSVVSLWYFEVPPQKCPHGYYFETKPLTKVTHSSAQISDTFTQISVMTDEIKSTKLDETAKFYQKPQGIMCYGAGFLAKIPNNNREYVFTAGHNTYRREKEKIYCIFGYTLDQCKDEKFFVPSDDVYPIKKIYERYGNKNKNKIDSEDWSILELTRKVQPPWRSATLSTIDLKIGHSISLYGFPEATPMNLRYGSYEGRYVNSFKADIFSCDNNSNRIFIANFPAYSGDSGGPIYNNDTDTVVGILRGGNTNYTVNTSGCYIDNPTTTVCREYFISIDYILQRIKELKLFSDSQLNPLNDFLLTEEDQTIGNQDNDLITVFVQLQNEQDHDIENSYFKMELSRQHNYEKMVEGIQKIFAKGKACNTSSTSTKSFPKKYKILTIDSNEKLIRLTKTTTLEHRAKVFFRYTFEQPNASSKTINPQQSTHITTTLNNPSNHEVSSITHSQPQQPQIVTSQNFPVQSFPNSNLNLNNNNYNNDNVPESKAVQQNKTSTKRIVGSVFLSPTEKVKFTIHLRSETIEDFEERISKALSKILNRPVKKEEFTVKYNTVEYKEIYVLTNEHLEQIKEGDEVQISLLPSSSIPRCSIS